MGQQTWEEVLGQVPVADSSADTATAETTLLHPSAVFTFPADYFYPGRSVRFVARGRFTTGATPGTIRFVLRYGAVSTGILLADTTAITPIVSLTNAIFSYECTITCRAVGNGTNGSLFAIGSMLGPFAVTGGGATEPGTLLHGSAGLTAPAAAGVDTTTATALNWAAVMSTASGDSITTHQTFVEALN